MNYAIHCSCGAVFSQRQLAQDHIDVWHNEPDAHTIIEETPAPSAIVSRNSALTDGPPLCAVCGHPSDNLRHATERRMEPQGCPGLPGTHEFTPASSGPPDETPRIALARQRIADLVISLGDVRTELVREQIAMEKASVAVEVARGKYESARARFVQVDKEIEAEMRALLIEVEGPAA